MYKTDALIIGGGLAGLTASIHLATAGVKVILVEKKQFPQYKVCGEYISNEVLQYWENLGIDPFAVNANAVQRFQLYAPKGTFVETPLPLGGFGIRRYTIDGYLANIAKNKGVLIFENKEIVKVEFKNNQFHCECTKGNAFTARIVLGAFGKRSKLDKLLVRPFFTRPSDYIGVKHFIKGAFPANLVALYNFKGGYCGAIQVEDGSTSIAYLTKATQLKKYKSVPQLEEQLLFQNPALKRLFQEGESLSHKAQTISNVSFLPKRQVVNHILMIGDAAGMIAPVCGNGMAMGIHAAKMASELSIKFIHGSINRDQLEKLYTKKWRQELGKRVFWGRQIQKFMGQNFLSEFAVQSLQKMPFLFPSIIKLTHGNVID